MAKKLPYNDGFGNPVVVSDDPKNPALYFDPNDPASRSVTNQSDKDSTDLNLIFAKYEKTGLIPDIITGDMRKPIFGDFTLVPDFTTMQRNIARTQQAFDALPASIRDEFKNDPQALIEFLADSKNDEKAVKLGLKDKTHLPVPDVVADPEGNLKKAPEPKAPGQPANPVA